MNINLTLVLNVITFFILLFLLKKFLFRHILKMMEKRKDYVKKSLDEVERLKREFSKDREQAKKELERTKRDALRIKEEALIFSEEYKEKKKEEVEKDILHLKKKAHEDMQLQLAKIKEDLKGYSLELSFKIAEKILKEEIDRKKHDKLLKESLKKLHEQGNYNA